MENKKYNFSFGAAYTLLMPYQEGLVLAIPENWKSNKIYPYKTVRSGFNAYFEKYLHYDDFKACLQYCWFYNNSSTQNSSLNPSCSYYSPWINSNDQNVTSINSSFNNQFNIIYVSLYRDNALTNTLNLTYNIGFLGAWEDQHLFATFVVDENLSTETNIYHLNYKQDWWTVSPFAGLKTGFLLAKKVELYVQSLASINLAKHFVTQIQTKASNLHESTVIENFLQNAFDLEPMVSAEIGMQTFYTFKDCAITANAAWQCQTWFNHNKFQRTLGAPLNANYSTTGLVAKFGIDF